MDAVITTRELARMIKSAGIDFVNLPEGSFDAPLGLSTGAADIFGVTGGVMEAALRTVYELVTGRELPFEGLHVTPIVGLEQIKTASFVIEDTLPEYKHLEGVELKIAVTSGLEGASMLMREVADICWKAWPAREAVSQAAASRARRTRISAGSVRRLSTARMSTNLCASLTRIRI